MRYLGVAQKKNGYILMPDTFADVPDGQTFEAIEIGQDILLTIGPLDRERLTVVERLAGRCIDEHRKSLEGLAR